MALTWPPTTHAHVTDQAILRHGLVAGRYYTAPGSAATVIAATLSRSTYQPAWIPAGTVDALVVRVTTAAAAASGALIRVGMYTDSAGVPGSLLIDAGTASTESVGAKEFAVSVPVTTGGLFWLTANPQVVTATFAGTEVAAGTPGVGQGSTADLNNSNHGFGQTGVTGALPATATPAGIIVSAIRVWYRMAP